MIGHRELGLSFGSWFAFAVNREMAIVVSEEVDSLPSEDSSVVRRVASQNGKVIGRRADVNGRHNE